jgi:hypothetical protein
VRQDGLGELEKFNQLIWNGTQILPACSIMPQQTTLTPYQSSLKINQPVQKFESSGHKSTQTTAMSKSKSKKQSKTILVIGSRGL